MKVTISPDVISEIVDDQAVLLDLRGGTYYSLNLVGTRVWTLFRERRRPEEVAEALESEFDAPAEVLVRDVMALTNELAARGLLIVEDE